MSAITAIKEKMPALPSFGWFGGLMKREFLDHKTGFFTLPLVIAGFMVVGIIYGAFYGNAQIMGVDLENLRVDGELVVENMEYQVDILSEMELRSMNKALGLAMVAMTFPLLVIIPFVIVFGLLGSLYDDRKDRSYLFWKSMPISDTTEVLSKLFAITVMGPAIIIGFSAAIHVFAMIVGSIFGAIHDLPVAKFLWNNVPTVSLWLGMIANSVVAVIMALPFVGWLSVVSSYASRAPLLFAAAPIAGVAAMEAIFFKSAHFAEWLGRQLSGWSMKIETEEFEGYTSTPDVSAPFVGNALDKLTDAFATGEFWFNTAVGVALIAAAIYFRRYRV